MVHDKNIPYLVVCKKAIEGAAVLCKYESYFILDLDKEQYHKFLMESARIHDFL